jgi:hypothetical protein
VPGVPLRDFYTSAAQACFTTLSVWWVILGLNKHWIRDAQRRLVVYDISLYFLLPGLMSLVSLLSEGVPLMWRVTFAIAGIAGAVESVALPIRRAPHGPAGRVQRTADNVSFVVFTVIATVAIRPTLVASVGLDLRPLAVEGLLIACSLLLGFGLAWHLFVTTASEHVEPEPEPAPALVRPSVPRSTRPAPQRSRRWWRTSGQWELAGETRSDG